MSDILNTSVVSDTDNPFVVDAITREITNKKSKKTVLMQGDHNSERFTFEIPRFIEGRDLKLCNSIQIHYINIDAKTRKQSTGVYIVDDFEVYQFLNDVVTCSWLIAAPATKYAGSSAFMIRFAEVTDEADVKYAWHTKTYEDIIVAETLDTADDFVNDYTDIIQQWKNSVITEMESYLDISVKEEVKEQTEVLAARVNNLLNAGTVDGELKDIRVGADGKTYGTAGEAVREQFTDLQNQNAYGNIFLNRQPIYEFVNATSAEITFPGYSEVFCNGKVYSIQNATAKYEFSEAYALFVILFNYSDRSIAIQHFGATLPEKTVIIGTAHMSTLRLNSYGFNSYTMNNIDSFDPINIPVWCDSVPKFKIETANGVNKMTVTIPKCYTTIGTVKYDIPAKTIEYETALAGLFNIIYNRLTSDMLIQHRSVVIPPDYQCIGIIHTSFGVYLNGLTSLSNVNNTAIAPLILGRLGSFVEIDSVNKVITFPDDTLILASKTVWDTTYYQLSVAKGNNTVSYASLTSSAIVIVYDTIDDVLKPITYNYPAYPHQIVVLSLRTTGGQVSVNAPYKWDGKPFNMDVDDLGIDLPTDDELKSNFMVKSINHRGYSVGAPENTLSAFKLSAKNGFDYVECDVSFTSDGVPVLLHDTTIDRTSNGTGNIGELTFDQVRAYDFGSWFSSEFAGELIPTFEEFIALCKKLALHPYIEIKSAGTYTQDQINLLVDIVKRHGMKGNVTYISFNSTYLGYVKNYDPSARLAFVVNEITESIITTAQGLKTDSNEVVVDSSYATLTDETVNLCIEADIPLELWTVNVQDWLVNTMPPYVTGVTSDNIHAGRTLYKANM